MDTVTPSANDLKHVVITDEVRDVAREVTEVHAALCRRVGIEP